MKKSIYQKTIDTMRSHAPLKARRLVGPILAYGAYHFNKYFYRLQQPKVLSIPQTIDLIINQKLSVIRFGDGEMTLVENGDLAFQKKNQELSNKLVEIIQKNEKGLLICVPGIWDKLELFEEYAQHFIRHHLFRYGHLWRQLLSPTQIYGDAYITRPYLSFKDRSCANEIFEKFFSVWGNKDVVLIEGEKSRLGVGNNLFDNTKSLKRILCPAENAFSKYETIKKEALKTKKDAIMLISLGPTAKVLAYDLFLAGYRVIDIGHIDMEYEMFLRKVTVQTKVKYKYFNEINERNPDDCNDSQYLSQILATIK